MKIDIIHDQTLDAAGAYMGRLAQRQQIVASNLANIDTPGYKTKDISFYATMQELLPDNSIDLKTSRSGHYAGDVSSSSPQAQPFEVQGLPTRVDNNNVDLDKEMQKLGDTSFGYSMMSQIVRGKLHTIATSINEGKS
jgi:flagellar basal-body rod protein FlgB